MKSAGPVCEQLGFFPEESRGVSFGSVRVYTLLEEGVAESLANTIGGDDSYPDKRTGCCNTTARMLWHEG